MCGALGWLVICSQWQIKLSMFWNTENVIKGPLTLCSSPLTLFLAYYQLIKISEVIINDCLFSLQWHFGYTRPQELDILGMIHYLASKDLYLKAKPVGFIMDYSYTELYHTLSCSSHFPVIMSVRATPIN